MTSTSAARGGLVQVKSSFIATEHRARLVAPAVLWGFLLLVEFERIASASSLPHRGGYEI